MVQMNFFNDYLEERKAEQRKLRQNILSFLALALLIGGVYGYLLWANTQYQNRIAEMQLVLNTPESIAERTEIANYKTKISVLDTYINNLKISNDAIASGVKFNRALLDTIMSVLPEGTTLSSFSFSSFNLRLNGNIPGAYMAPSLINNLRETGLFLDLAPITISNDQGSTSFSVTCILKGGALQ